MINQVAKDLSNLSLDDIKEEVQKQSVFLSRWQKDRDSLQNQIKGLNFDKEWLQNRLNQIQSDKNELVVQVDNLWNDVIPNLQTQIRTLKNNMDQQFKKKMVYRKKNSLLINIGHILVFLMCISKYNDGSKDLTLMTGTDRKFVHHVLGDMYGCTIIDNRSNNGYYYQKDYIQDIARVKQEIYVNSSKYEALWVIMTGHGQPPLNLKFSNGAPLPILSVRAAFANTPNGLGDCFVDKPKFFTADCCLGPHVVRPVNGDAIDTGIISKGGDSRHPFENTFIMLSNVEGYKSFGTNNGSFLIRSWLNVMVKGKITNFNEKIFELNKQLTSLSGNKQICELISVGSKKIFFRGYPNINKIERSINDHLEIMRNISAIQAKSDDIKSQIEIKCKLLDNFNGLNDILTRCVSETDDYLDIMSPQQPSNDAIYSDVNGNNHHRPIPKHFVADSKSHCINDLNHLDYGFRASSNNRSDHGQCRSTKIHILGGNKQSNSISAKPCQPCYNKVLTKSLIETEQNQPRLKNAANPHCLNRANPSQSLPLQSSVKPISNTDQNESYICDPSSRSRKQQRGFFNRHKKMPSSSTITISHRKPFKCLNCNKWFNTKKERKIHTERVHGPRNYKCDKCSKSYGLKTDLKIHQRIHQTVNPFPCSVCSKRFAAAQLLQQHQQTHSQRSHRCNICGRMYKHKSNLSTHKKSHQKQPLSRKKMQ